MIQVEKRRNKKNHKQIESSYGIFQDFKTPNSCLHDTQETLVQKWSLIFDIISAVVGLDTNDSFSPGSKV